MHTAFSTPKRSQQNSSHTNSQQNSSHTNKQKRQAACERRPHNRRGAAAPKGAQGCVNAKRNGCQQHTERNTASATARHDSGQQPWAQPHQPIPTHAHTLLKPTCPVSVNTPAHSCFHFFTLSVSTHTHTHRGNAGPTHTHKHTHTQAHRLARYVCASRGHAPCAQSQLTQLGVEIQGAGGAAAKHPGSRGRSCSAAGHTFSAAGHTRGCVQNRVHTLQGAAFAPDANKPPHARKPQPQTAARQATRPGAMHAPLHAC